MGVVLGRPLRGLCYSFRCMFCHGGDLRASFERCLIHFPLIFLSWRWSWDVHWEVFDALSVMIFVMEVVLGRPLGDV